MSVDLRRRDTAVLELMDDPACDEQALRRTYAGFARVNRLVSGWRGTYRDLLDHLEPAAFEQVLGDTRQLAGELVVHSDLRRSRVAYLGWSALARPLGRGTFLHTDGLRSIRRSHTAAELRAMVPPGWRVQPQRPFRLLLTWSRRG